VNGYEVDNLPVPKNIDEKIQKDIEKLVDKILAAKKKNYKENTSELESKIDEMVYKLYDLTPEEIEIVDPSSSSTSTRQAGKDNL
jgi:DNA-binding transcriptional regulator GbsR (MarR family)